MRLSRLLLEALTAARTAPVPSGLVLLVVAAMCFGALSTVGRQAALEASLAEELSGPSARMLVVTDTGGSGSITEPVVTALSEVEGVGAVIGRERPVDAVNGALGAGSPLVAVVALHGTAEQAIQITRGRLPGPGEVVIARGVGESLRLAQPSGVLESADGRQWAVVGEYIPRVPFGDLAGVAVTLPGWSPEAVMQQVRVVAGSVENARRVQESSLAILDLDPSNSQVIPAAALSQTALSVTGQVIGQGRSALILILTTGSFFVTVVVLADVLIRRRDLGRRRTLGITRADLVTLVAARTAAPAVLGAFVGSLLGRLSFADHAGAVPWDFTLAVAVLASVVAVLASLVPALIAALRDPVAVLRTA